MTRLEGWKARKGWHDRTGGAENGISRPRALREGKGPRHLRLRGSPAARGHRPDLGVRRGPSNGDSGKREGSHGALCLLVSPHRGPGPEPSDHHRGGHVSPVCQPYRDVLAGRSMLVWKIEASPHRMHRARLSRRIGLDGLLQESGSLSASSFPLVSWNPAASTRRSSHPRRKPSGASTT